MPRGGAPGTLYVIEPEVPEDARQGEEAGRFGIAAHSLDPARVLAFARALGARPIRTLIVGCEPARPGEDDEDDEEMRMGLSAPVQAALEEAARMVDELMREMLDVTRSETQSYAEEEQSYAEQTNAAINCGRTVPPQ